MWALKQRGLVPDAMDIIHVNGSQATSMVCSTQSNSPYVWMRYEHVRDGVYERVCMCLTLRPESQSGQTYKSSLHPPPPLIGNILVQNKARENKYILCFSLGHTLFCKQYSFWVRPIWPSACYCLSYTCTVCLPSAT